MFLAEWQYYTYSKDKYNFALVRTCGQTGLNVSANFVPFQGVKFCGSSKRKLPTGGAAYGTDRNASTGSKCLEFNSNITPRIAPVFVSTIRELYRGPAITVFVSNNNTHCTMAHCRLILFGPTGACMLY